MNTGDYPRISVLTPSFNQSKYIRATLESVFAQDYPNLEYIVVDGGSNDGSVEIIEEYQDRLAYFISEPDRGQSHAINKGFARAGGDILCWLNSDDQFAPGALWAMAVAFMTSDAEMVAGICEVYDDDVLVHRHLTCCEDGQLPLAPMLDLDNGWNAGQFFYQPEVFFSRELWNRAGAHVREDCFYSMDYELWCRFAEANAKLKVIGVPIARFRSHPEQKTADPGQFMAELREVRNTFVEQHAVQYQRSERPGVDWSRRLRVALLNDLGYRYGAGLAHMRIAGAFDLAAHDVGAFDLLSSDKADYRDIVARIRQFRPDIIVFGNLHGIEKRSVAVLGQLSEEYPCYWVTHDFWLLTGRCPYTGPCDKYLSGCDESCPTAHQYPVIPADQIHPAWQTKWQFLREAKNLTILANSDWSQRRFSQTLSAKGSGVEVHRIRLGVPVEIFQDTEKQASRTSLGIPEGSLALAFSVSSISDERKGGSLLLEAVTNLARRLPVCLILIGRLDQKIELPDVTMVKLGYVENVRILASALAAADIYVGPSAEETFGQVFIEAAMCGTPSIGFDATGVTSAIEHGISGIRVEEQSANALENAILALADDTVALARMRLLAPYWAKNEYSLEASYRSFFSVLDRQGHIDRLGLPHKISFSRASQVITHSTRGWVQQSLAGRCNMIARRSIERMIGLLPTDIAGKVRTMLPKPVQRTLIRWLSGRKY